MVTEALSWEQNSMPPASPWELAWRESLVPSLVVGAFCTYAGRKETPKQDNSVLLRTSSLHWPLPPQERVAGPHPALSPSALRSPLSGDRDLFPGTHFVVLARDLGYLWPWDLLSTAARGPKAMSCELFAVDKPMGFLKLENPYTIQFTHSLHTVHWEIAHLFFRLW